MERDGNNGIDGLVSGLILIRECGINTLENVMDGEFRFYDLEVLGAQKLLKQG